MPPAATGFVHASALGRPVATEDDVMDLLALAGPAGIVLTEADLDASFFDLRSGLAGVLMQKFVNYYVRAAIVVADPAAHGERFAELALEHARRGDVRFVESVEAAEAFLAR